MQLKPQHFLQTGVKGWHLVCVPLFIEALAKSTRWFAAHIQLLERLQR
jgi:hypothetical protein